MEDIPSLRPAPARPATGLALAILLAGLVSAGTHRTQAATLLTSLNFPASSPGQLGASMAPTSGREGVVFQPGAAVSMVSSPSTSSQGEISRSQPVSAESTSAARTTDRAASSPERHEESPSHSTSASNKRASSRAEAEPAAPQGSKKEAPKPGTVSTPDYKQAGAAIVTTAQPTLSLDLGWSWYNKYYFRGLDILKAVSPKTVDSGVINSRVALGYAREKDAFTLGFTYVQALGRQMPKGAAASAPNEQTKEKGQTARKDNEEFSLPPEERYAEYNFYAAYTRELIPGQLQGTLGYYHYQFSDGNWWQTDEGPVWYTNESRVRLDYTGLPYIRPSLMWAHDFDGFKGDYLELRAESGFDLMKKGSVSIRLEPYVDVSYDFQYNGEDNGWNALEAGATLAIRLNEYFTLSLNGNYTKALEDTGSGNQSSKRVDEGFWGGVVFSAVWGNIGAKTEPVAPDGKDSAKLVRVPEEPKNWEMSLGMGWRQVNYDYHHRDVSKFDVRKLYNRKPGQVGVLEFAQMGFNNYYYGDGAVFVRGEDGTALYAVDNEKQYLGVPGSNGSQVYFPSDTYSYRYESDSYSVNADDQDSVAYPYITLDREVWRKGSLSLRLGVLYSYTRSDSDSGARLARVDSLWERTNEYGFVYATDAVQASGAPRIVINAEAYRNTYAQSLANPNVLLQAQPQSSFFATDAQVVNVASYVRTNVDLTANDLALPITLRKDLGQRVHAELSVAPTLTLASGEVFSDVQQREIATSYKVLVKPKELKPTGGAIQARSVNTNLNEAQTADVVVLPINGDAVSANDPSKPASVGPNAVPSKKSTSKSSSGGGKSSGVSDAPEYPGSLVARQNYRADMNKLLFGVAGSASLVLDLNEEGSFFVELWGRYHWVDKFSASNGFASVDIDLSSFQGGVGVGVRF